MYCIQAAIQRAFSSNMSQAEYELLLRDIAEGVTKHRSAVYKVQFLKKSDEEELKELEFISTKLSKEAQ